MKLENGEDGERMETKMGWWSKTGIANGTLTPQPIDYSSSLEMQISREQKKHIDMCSELIIIIYNIYNNEKNKYRLTLMFLGRKWRHVGKKCPREQCQGLICIIVVDI